MIKRIIKRLFVWQIKTDLWTWNKWFPKEPIRIITEEDYKHFNEMQNYFRDEN